MQMAKEIEAGFSHEGKTVRDIGEMLEEVLEPLKDAAEINEAELNQKMIDIKREMDEKMRMEIFSPREIDKALIDLRREAAQGNNRRYRRHMAKMNGHNGHRGNRYARKRCKK